MTDEHPQRLDLLILARLATTKQRPSQRELEKQLFPFVEARLSRHEWSACVARRLEALRAKGEIDERRVPTAQGLGRLREALGVQTLPSGWSKVWRALMPALALDLPGARWSDIATADKLRARLIRQEYQLPVPEAPTLTQAVDAQAWLALGLDETGPLTLGKLRRALLEQTLGGPIRGRSVDTNRAGQWLATIAAGTTTRDIAAVQRTLVHQWLFHAEPSEPTEAPPSDETEAKDEAPQRPAISTAKASPSIDGATLEGWAQGVQSLADSTSHGRYGDERVFIASVWEAAKSEPSLPSESLSAFKARLLEANRKGLLRLHRADLVGAMSDQLVTDSETRHLNATFHFIEITPRSKS